MYFVDIHTYHVRMNIVNGGSFKCTSVELGNITMNKAERLSEFNNVLRPFKSKMEIISMFEETISSIVFDYLYESV